MSRPAVIVKRTKRPPKGVHSDASRSASSYAKALCDYLDDVAGDGAKLRDEGHGEDEALSFGINFFAANDDRDSQIKELAANAELSTNEKANKIEHLVISLEQGRDFTPEQWKDAANIILTNLGMQSHLCRASVHRNEDNIHLHLVVCKVNPEASENGKYYINNDKGSVTEVNKAGKPQNNIAMCLQRAAAEIAVKNGLEVGKFSRFDEKLKLLSPKERIDRCHSYDLRSFQKWAASLPAKKIATFVAACPTPPPNSGIDLGDLSSAMQEGNYEALAEFWTAAILSAGNLFAEDAQNAARQVFGAMARLVFAGVRLPKYKPREYDAEKFTDKRESMTKEDRIVYEREPLLQMLKTSLPVAKSWAEFKSLLPAQVLLSKKGQGAVISFYGSNGESRVEIKLSDIQRELSFAKLSKQYTDKPFSDLEAKPKADEKAEEKAPTAPVPTPTATVKKNADDGGGQSGNTEDPAPAPAPVPVPRAEEEDQYAKFLETKPKREEYRTDWDYACAVQIWNEEEELQAEIVAREADAAARAADYEWGDGCDVTMADKFASISALAATIARRMQGKDKVDDYIDEICERYEREREFYEKQYRDDLERLERERRENINGMGMMP